MNRTVKKIIGVILAMITVLSVLSVSVYAEDNSYTEENIQITEEKEDNPNPFSDMDILQATEISLRDLQLELVLYRLLF